MKLQWLGALVAVLLLMMSVVVVWSSIQAGSLDGYDTGNESFKAYNDSETAKEEYGVLPSRGPPPQRVPREVVV